MTNLDKELKWDLKKEEFSKTQKDEKFRKGWLLKCNNISVLDDF